MFYYFILLCICSNLILCQNNNHIHFNSKLILDDFQPYAASFEENPIWNYDAGDTKEETIIPPEELEDTSDSLNENSDELNDSVELKPPKQSARNLNNLNSNTNEQSQLEPSNLPTLFELEDNEYQNPYRNLNLQSNSGMNNLDESTFELLTRPRKKNSREIRPYVPRLRNSYINFVKDDDFDDFDSFDNDNINKINENNNTTKNDKLKLEDNKNDLNETKKSEQDFENIDNLEIKLDDIENDEQYGQKLRKDNQSDKVNKEDNLLKKDIIPMLKPTKYKPLPKPNLESKVIYTDKDDQKEVKKVEDNDHLKISTTTLKPPTQYIDQPSLEPRIKKLRRIRRLRKQRLNRQNNQPPIDKSIKESIKNDVEQNLKDVKSLKSNIEDKNGEQVVNDAVKKVNAESNRLLKQNQENNQTHNKPIQIDKTIYIDQSNPETNKKSNRVIRIVKVIKKNPNEQEIESNVSSVSKTSVNSETKDESKNVRVSTPNDPSKNNTAKLNQTEPVNKKLANYSSIDDYIDEFEDVETKKSKIKHVLY